MNFIQYKTADELLEATGLTIEEALKIVDAELKQLREKRINREKTRGKSIKASDYNDFKDYCAKNNFTSAEGIEQLEKELKKERERSREKEFDINDYPKAKKYMEDTGLSLDQAMKLLEIKLKTL